MNASPSDRAETFVSLLDRNKKILYKVARAYGRSAEDRDDLTQEMTAALWSSFGRYNDHYRFSTWMYRVVLNVAISFYRSEQRRSRHASVIDFSSFDIASDNDATTDAEPDQRLARLNDFISALGDLDKALMLLYLESYRYEEIAKMLGLAESNVGTKLNRIRQRARVALAFPTTRPQGNSHDAR